MKDLRKLSNKELKEIGDFASGASIINNFGSFLNNTNDRKEKESWRALVLLTTDFINTVAKGKVAKINSGVASGAIVEKLRLDIIDFNTQYKDNNGYIKSATLIDIVSGSSAFISNFVGLFKLSPIGVALNMVSVLYSAISNIMSSTKYEEMIHVSELDDVLAQATVLTLVKIAKDMADFKKMLEELVPEDYKFWSEDTIELIGTDGNDDFVSLSAYLHDRSRVIFANDGNDTLYGDDNYDMLHGGTGNDILNGGKGDDTLIGAQGFDTYHIKDHDTIYDSDGKGRILFDNKQLPTDFILKQGSSEIWEAKDHQGKVLYTAIKGADDLLITSTNSAADSVTIKDFFTHANKHNTTYSALSITLADNPNQANTQGVYYIKTDDRWASHIYTGGFPASHLDITGSDKVDNIVGTGKKSLLIATEGGNDLIFGGDMQDRLDGGVGNDVIYGSPAYYDFEPQDSQKLPKPQTDQNDKLIGVDKDIIIGGKSNDLISAGIGDDVIWVDEEYKANGKTPIHTDSNNPNNKHNNQKGDWALGGRGNDIVYGGVNKDFLQGGADSDYLYGGGGDDVILGDGHIRFGTKSKTLNSHDTTNHNPTVIGGVHPLVPGSTILTPSITQGQILSVEYQFDQGKPLEKRSQYSYLRDPKTFDWSLDINQDGTDYILEPHKEVALLYDYHLLAQEHLGKNNNDFLYGGAGNDFIVGQYGHDTLYGNSGDDILYGDDNRDTTIVGGNDTLIGGTGKDILIGGKGNDTYRFDLDDLKTAKDNKIIQDMDNQGKIVIGNFNLTDTQFFKINASNVYQTQDKRFTLARHNGRYLDQYTV